MDPGFWWVAREGDTTLRCMFGGRCCQTGGSGRNLTPRARAELSADSLQGGQSLVFQLVVKTRSKRTQRREAWMGAAAALDHPGCPAQQALFKITSQCPVTLWAMAFERSIHTAANLAQSRGHTASPGSLGPLQTTHAPPPLRTGSWAVASVLCRAVCE